MESCRMTSKTTIGQVWKWKEAWRRVLFMKGGCQSVVYLQDNVKPAQNKTNDRDTSQIIKGTRKESLLS
jgi:hypothetical protein